MGANLKSFVKNVVKRENLDFISIDKNLKIDIEIIKKLIVEVFKKYETFYEIENNIYDVIFGLKGVENLNEDEVERAEELVEIINDKVLANYYDMLDIDVLVEILEFLIENKIKIFENELKYKYAEVNLDVDSLRCLVDEAKSNVISSWIYDKTSIDMDFYDNIIESLNESMGYRLKSEENK